MSDEPRPRSHLDDPKIKTYPLGEASVEMTLAQWVETLPPGHVARNELLYLREGFELYVAQVARLPGADDDGSLLPHIDAVLKRILDVESALAILVELVNKHYEPVDSHYGPVGPEEIVAMLDVANKVLARRPSGMAGTAHGVSKGGSE